MYTKPRYMLKDVILWTKWETFFFIFNACIPTVLYKVYGVQWLHIPWTAVALVGTAVAFLISFQNNAAYGRIWEARKIWGGVINMTRSWVNQVQAIIPDQSKQKTFLYRHIAWLTGLRFSMREQKPWETFQTHFINRSWDRKIYVPEKAEDLPQELGKVLSKQDFSYVEEKANKAQAVINLQAKELKDHLQKNEITEYSFVKLLTTLEELTTLQGKSERIKNFPYPRQYATIGFYLTWTFILLLPYALIAKFIEMAKDLNGQHSFGENFIFWASVPFITLVSWAFHTMEKVGRAGENPFEGTANDVPISSISRNLEIEIRQFLEEEEIPKPYEAPNNVQM